MAQCRDRSCLTLETDAGLRIGNPVDAKKFQSDIAAKPRIARAEHLTHAAAPKLRQDLERPYGITGGDRHSRPS